MLSSLHVSIFQHVNLGIVKWGVFHPIFVHYPVALFTLVMVCDFLNLFRKPLALYVGHWLVIGGTLSALFAIGTGWYAAEHFDTFDEVYPMLVRHMYLGYFIGVYGVFYSTLRGLNLAGIVALYSPYVYLAISAVLFIIVLYTGELGGLITHGETPFESF